MGLKKLIKSLQKSLSGEVSGELTARERIEELLGEFEKKEKVREKSWNFVFRWEFLYFITISYFHKKWADSSQANGTKPMEK